MELHLSLRSLLCIGFSGADLANLLNEAAILTGRKALSAITSRVRILPQDQCSRQKTPSTCGLAAIGHNKRAFMVQGVKEVCVFNCYIWLSTGD